ncbi:MAG: sulfide/dihydroorotate dehydrogenase-like FAD/NAD-binding protein [Dehalococcoidia bacterium]|nr:sulfide/dihydroorotate dehydrogenase-like FAD/NAD-binding protein [Dehalococcoidia bacterium]
MARILRKRSLTPITSLFVVEAPMIARNAQPGQFVMARISESGERIPVTFTNYDVGEGTVTVVVQEVGKTTRMFSALGEGDEILDFVGPLGRPAPLPERGHVALLGGGFGAAAILTLAKELHSRSVEVSSIVGARSSDLLILDDEVGAVSDHLYICTDDGSSGFHGFVTIQLTELIDQGISFDEAIAIGPVAMMRALAEATRPYGLRTQVSMDPIMVDGTGMCGACRITVDDELKFACVDGPFFDAHKVNFAEATIRSKMYVEEEQMSLTLDKAGG